MELSCSHVVAWIRLTQVLYPLADGRKGFRYCTSCNRVVFAAVASVADPVHEEVAEPKFRVAQELTEGAGDRLLVAELDPVTEGGGL